MAFRTDNADGWQYREDRGELLRPVRRGGILFVEGVAARECVLEYRRADGTMRREYVPASTLKKAGTKLSRATVTLLHPDPVKHPNGVTDENYAELGVGDVDGEVIVGDGGFTKVRLAIRRKDAIDAIESGSARELSCGYRVRLDETPGEHPEFGRFDATQVERTDNNHLALVPVARAGHEAKVRADGATATTVFRADSANTAGSPARSHQMLSILLQGLALLGNTERYDTEDLAANALVGTIKVRQSAAERADADRTTELATAVKARDDAKVTIATLTTDRDAQKARADAAEAELVKLRADAKARADADERVKLEPLCTKLRVDAKDHPELPKLKRALATAHHGKELPKEWTEAHVDAAVEFALQDRADGREAGKKLWTPGGGNGGSGTRTDARPANGGSGTSVYQRALARSAGFRNAKNRQDGDQ